MPEQASLESGAADASTSKPGQNPTDLSALPADLEGRPEAHLIASDHEAPKPDTSTSGAPKADALKIQLDKIQLDKFDGSRPDAERKPESKPEPTSGRLVVMTPADRRSRERESFAQRGRPEETRAARSSAMAAVIVFAGIVGAASGALATAGMTYFTASPQPVAANVSAPDNSALEASVARIDADIAELRASLDRTARIDAGQLSKTAERLDKLEKAQAEPMAKLAKLSEAVDKLRASSQASGSMASAQVAVRESTTGSVAPSSQTASATAPRGEGVRSEVTTRSEPKSEGVKSEIGRLPTVEGWRLRDVANGSALIEGRDGLYQVFAGDPLPGLGRVDAIRRQDGHWVVVTRKGLIVAR